MTNYNKRLEEIFPDESKDTELQRHLRNVWHDNFSEQEFIDEMEAYITSLIKELVAEAKPGRADTQIWRENPDDAWDMAIDQFEQNLLKALEEV